MIAQLLTYFAARCPGGSLLGFPTWYKYLDGQTTPVPVVGPGATTCTPVINGGLDIWLILAAVIEILLRIAALLAVGFVIWGGISYITSQGQPDATAKAQHTVTNAIIGLIIAIAATTVVTFAAGRFN